MNRVLLPVLAVVLELTYRWSLTLPAAVAHADSCSIVSPVAERDLARLDVWARGRGPAWGDMLALWWFSSRYPGMFPAATLREQWARVRAEAVWRRVESHDAVGLEGRRVHLYAPPTWVRFYVVAADVAGNVSCPSETVAAGHGVSVGAP